MVRPGIVAVCGATGKQGGSVVDHLLLSDRWRGRIRALTRGNDQAKMAALKAKGVEVVKADLTDRASLVKAFTNVDTLFLMTNCFDPSANERDEYQQALMAAEAAKEAGVENIVFSSLENLEKATDGKYKVAPFTLKAKAADKILQMGFASATIVEPGFYMQNLHTYLPPMRLADGTLAYAFPCTKDLSIPFIDIRDFGGVVAKIIDDPGRFNHQTVPIAAEYVSIANIGGELSKALRAPVTFKPISDDEARANGIHPAFIEMFHAFETSGYYGKRVEFDLVRSLYPKMKSWREYLESINLDDAFGKIMRGEGAAAKASAK